MAVLDQTRRQSLKQLRKQLVLSSVEMPKYVKGELLAYVLDFLREKHTNHYKYILLLTYLHKICINLCK